MSSNPSLVTSPIPGIDLSGRAAVALMRLVRGSSCSIAIN
jgi:hypothetical protein